MNAAYKTFQGLGCPVDREVLWSLGGHLGAKMKSRMRERLRKRLIIDASWIEKNDNEWIKMNERINERINERMNERMNEWVHGWMKWNKEWLNELMMMNGW